VREALRDRTARWFVLAIVVGFVLRLGWVIWAAQAPAQDVSDPGRFYVMAQRFSMLQTEQINGNVTAFTAPGYSFVLAPFAWLDRSTGWISLAFSAALLNVVFGTAMIVETGVLAGQWFGRAARNPAAWLVALSPGYVYFTSTLLSETLFTTLVVLALVATTWLLTRGRPPTWRALVALGLLVGFATLVRFPAALLLPAPALALRATSGSWRGALRATAWTTLGAVVLLLPWAIRNQYHVGVFTPTSTNSAAYLCTGHHEGSQGEIVYDGPPECYEGSPFDEPGQVDEARWYRETTRDALGHAISDPVVTARNALWKTWDAMATDRDALDAAQDYGRQPLVGDRVTLLLDGLANVWHWGVLVLGAVGLALLPSCRRAIPLWATSAAMLALVWGGVGLTRFHTPFMAIVATFAAAALVATARGARAVPSVALPNGDVDERISGEVER
jgi:hypothetical protein